jgi:hypothetical protein
MSARTLRRNSKSEPQDHPVVPGSVLYRALQQVARAVARRLAAQPNGSRQTDRQATDERTSNYQPPISPTQPPGGAA